MELGILGLKIGDLTGRVAKAAENALKKVDPAAKHVDTPVEKPGERAQLLRDAQSQDPATRRSAEAQLKQIEI